MKRRWYNTKCKLEARILILFLAILIFSPILTNAQQINISVGAQVSGPTPTPTATPTPPPPPPPGGGGPVYIPAETKVIFKGRAYPLAVLTLLKNNTVISTFGAESSGLFEREIRGIAPGTYNFSIFAEDTEGRKSVTIGFTAPVLEGRTTTISGIFISPTIELGPTQVERGQDVNIAGQSFPESEIKIFVASTEVVKETKATSKGKWTYKLNTGFLQEGEHGTRAKAFMDDGEQSQFSQTLTFLVLKKGALVCKGADLNFDGKVNIIDFSILLYFWKQTKPANICVDINRDGIVNIIDFSIMMYWWTG